MKKSFLSTLLACLPLIAHGAAAPASPARVDLSFTGQPRSYDITGKPYQALGYGEARFGMTADAVKQVLAASWPAQAAAVKDSFDPVTRNRSLTLVVPQLAPGPGPATMSYVFGARCQCLIAVNTYWLAADKATPAQQAALTEAAASLVSGLLGQQWPPLSSVRGHVLGGNSLVVFSGKDAQGGGVEVRLDGVPIDVEARKTDPDPKRKLRRLPPPGPAQLRLSVVANSDHPDVYRIPAKAFMADGGRIDGFRSARFGMDETSLKAAIVQDFQADPAALSAVDNPVEKTRVIVLRLAALDPGPGPATVTYILGAASKRLIHVNVTWSGAPDASEAERSAIAAAGVQLADHLRGQLAKPGAATAGVPDANGVVLFATTNARNAAIQLRLSGVPIGERASHLPPGTRARLTLSYIADVRHPDVATPQEGAR
jgi:hypothetical protein